MPRMSAWGPKSTAPEQEKRQGHCPEAGQIRDRRRQLNCIQLLYFH